MTTTTYSTNNSGGDWWLDDNDWLALEAAGWNVAWVKDEDPAAQFSRNSGGSGRWLGALATEASREGLTMRQAIAEWEAVTGERSNAMGCSCCGVPHSFSTDDGDYYSPSFPAYGDSY